MGGCGGIIAFTVGSYLFNIEESLPFFAGSVFFLMALWVIYKNIDEKRDSLGYTASTSPKINYKQELNSATNILVPSWFGL